MFTITRDDFRIKASSFNLADTRNVLRIMTGAWMFPHIAGKFANGGLNPGTVGFFAKAGMTPGEFWVALAAGSEFAIGVALVLGIATRFAGLGAAAVLAIATYAVLAVKGFGWTWNTGGVEFNVFWSLSGILVAADAWKQYFESVRKSPFGLRPIHATA